MLAANTSPSRGPHSRPHKCKEVYVYDSYS